MSRPFLLFPALVLATVAACGGSGATKVSSGTGPMFGAAPLDEPAGLSAGPREQDATQQVNHVLSRLTFGAKPGDVAKVREIGVDRWIDQQLHPERINDAATEQYLKGFESQTLSAAELEQKYPRPNQALARLGAAKGDRGTLSRDDSVKYVAQTQGLRRMAGEMQSTRVARAVLSERQLEEVMTDFWLNHFNVYIQKGGPERYLLASYENSAIRPNALGNFRSLLGAVAHDPAMLFYLDNWQSQADSNRPRLVEQNAGRARVLAQARRLPPAQARQLQAAGARRKGGLNENYGRELLELHTLGVDGGYTQADVIGAARILTGWAMKQPVKGGGFQFVPAMHDAGEKTVLGHHFAAGHGEEEGEQLLDIVASHPATAHYIAFKLARRFVSDVPPTALVDRAAATFMRTHGDIRAVMKTIVTSPEFFSKAAYRSKVKAPFEVVVSALRALDAKPDPTPRTAQVVSTLGQPLWGHQAPNGWPETGDQWMNTGAILNRINFGLALASNRVPGVSVAAWSGAQSLQNLPLDQQVDGVVKALLGGESSPDTRSILLSGENPFLKSAAALDTTPGRVMTPDPDDPTMAPEMAPEMATRNPRAPARDRAFGPLAPAKGLAQIVGLAIGSPEFQRR
jgi:uncharacterized protein (DUF1800 family)